MNNSNINHLIVSTIGDYSTKIIADWLNHFSVKVHIINTDVDFINVKSIKIREEDYDLTLNVSNKFSLSNKNTNVVFFRRGLLHLSNITNSSANPEDFFDIRNRVKYFFTTYELAQKEFVNDFFMSGYKYGKDNGSRTNKILSLKITQKCGLKIPHTLVTTSKNELLNWATEREKKIITKSLDIGMFYGNKDNNKMYHQLTKTIDVKDFMAFDKCFPLTLFQERIEKIVELRVFYLDGKVWTGAILSQNQNNTIDDYRNYNQEKMNRIVPFKIPASITKKIIRFMNEIKLETGSIDIILAEDNQYYFLEVNPSGQFSGLSSTCNFYLEREIAKNMIYNGKKNSEIFI